MPFIAWISGLLWMVAFRRIYFKNRFKNFNTSKTLSKSFLLKISEKKKILASTFSKCCKNLSGKTEYIHLLSYYLLFRKVNVPYRSWLIWMNGRCYRITLMLMVRFMVANSSSNHCFRSLYRNLLASISVVKEQRSLLELGTANWRNICLRKEGRGSFLKII